MSAEPPASEVVSSAPGLVSVIVPTFNRRERVVTAIDSVLAQDYASFEVVVVDDGSTDDTMRMLAARYGDEPRVRCVRQQNAGVSLARNRGMSEATGEFIAFLDSDDEWLPWKLTAQLAVMRAHPEVGMVWTDMRAVDDSGETLADRYLRRMYRAYRLVDLDAAMPVVEYLADLAPDLPAGTQDAIIVRTGSVYPAIIQGNLVHTSTVLLRHSWATRVDGFDARLSPTGEDHDYHLRTARLGPVSLIDGSAVRYRIGAADQLTAPKYELRLAENFLATVDKAIRAHDGPPLPRAIQRRARGDAHQWLGAVLAEQGERRRAWPHALRAVVRSPRDRSVRRLVLRLLAPQWLASRRR